MIGIGLSSSYAQEVTNASGGDAFGSGGSVAYSIGLVIYTSESGSSGTINQGIQQPYDISTVGIDDEASNIMLKTFPNPTSDCLTLQVDDLVNEKLDYQLFDLQGKLMQHEDINKAQTLVDLSVYAKGTYFIKVIRESEDIKTFIIIKK